MSGVWDFRARCAALAGLLLSVGCQPGLTSGIDYPDVSDVELDDYLLTPEGAQEPSVSLTHFKFSKKSCEGIDTRMALADLDQEDLTRFFASRGLNLKPRKARGDLYWYEITSQEEGEEPEVVVPKTKTTGESSIGKGSVELYSYMNEVGCQYLKIPASQSIVLTKA